MTKTSHKKNRPFDFKLIELVEPHQVLYQRQTGMSTFATMKAKNDIWKQISAEINHSIEFCIMRWNNLRGQFQKELRRCRELCPKRGIIPGSTWPYLDRLRFLEDTVQFNRPKQIRVRKKAKKATSDSEPMDYDQSFADIANNSEEDTADSDFMNEMLNNDSEHFTIIEEAPEESYTEQHTSEWMPAETIQQSTLDTSSTTANLQRMDTLLVGIEGENRARVERRIMAFLCKLQLRALYNEDVDDLVI